MPQRECSLSDSIGLQGPHESFENKFLRCAASACARLTYHWLFQLGQLVNVDLVMVDLHNLIDHVLESRDFAQGALKKLALAGRRDVREDDYQSRVQFNLPH